MGRSRCCSLGTSSSRERLQFPALLSFSEIGSGFQSTTGDDAWSRQRHRRERGSSSWTCLQQIPTLGRAFDRDRCLLSRLWSSLARPNPDPFVALLGGEFSILFFIDFFWVPFCCVDVFLVWFWFLGLLEFWGFNRLHVGIDGLLCVWVVGGWYVIELNGCNAILLG